MSLVLVSGGPVVPPSSHSQNALSTSIFKMTSKLPLIFDFDKPLTMDLPPIFDFDVPLTMEFPNVYLLAGLVGVLAHVLVFRVGEWDVASPSIFVFHVLVIAATGLASHSQLTQFHVPATQIVACAGSYIAGLYMSMMLYRAFFHRLSKFPGPFLARLSNFYITARSVKKLHLFEEVQELHSQYGDYVRLGKF